MPPALKKLYYSIREVSDLTGVEPHVLRFWEKEFSMLRPRRGKSGNRTYRERDIETVKTIKGLLWDEKYTIQGAVEKLKAGPEDRDPAIDGKQIENPDPLSLISEVRTLLVELKGLLEKTP